MIKIHKSPIESSPKCLERSAGVGKRQIIIESEFHGPRKLIRAFQHHFRVGALKYNEIMRFRWRGKEM